MDEDWDRAIDDELATGSPPWLRDRVAVVAGGGLSGPDGGVGFSIAWQYARHGARVAILDRDPEAAGRAVAMIRRAGGAAEAFPADLVAEESVEAALAAVVDRLGPVDLVADSLGGGGSAPILGATAEDWDRAMQLNLRSAWLLLRAAAPRMREGGAMVFVSSVTVEGHQPGMPYTVAKAALEQLVIGAASSLAPRGIRVNCVRIGMIWGAFAARGVDAAQRELRRRSVQLRTEGNVWDIAEAALFLSTPQSRWISGQILAVDGGGAVPAEVGQAGQASHRGSADTTS